MANTTLKKIRPHLGITYEEYKTLSKENINIILKYRIAEMHHTYRDTSGNVIAEGKFYEMQEKLKPLGIQINIEHLLEYEYKEMKEKFEAAEEED